MFPQLKVFKYVVAGIVILALLAGIVGGAYKLYQHIYNSGYEASETKWKIAQEAERARLKEIADKINQTHKEDIAGLERQNERLEEAFKELELSAAQEQAELEKKLAEAIEAAKASGEVVVVDRPVGLSPSSVRRLNRIH